MTRAKLLGTGAVVVSAGVILGLSDVRSASEGVPAVEEELTHFMLDAVIAEVPVDTSASDLDAEPRVLETQVGSASFYANSLAGRRTASGVRYDPREMVAAHRSLPFGSLLRVTNEANGQVVKVRVVDRGPFARGRVLDLSRVAAEELGFIRRGHTRVTIEVLEEVEDDTSDG